MNDDGPNVADLKSRMSSALCEAEYALKALVDPWEPPTPRAVAQTVLDALAKLRQAIDDSQ